ncbi:thioesterase II family protein [Lachnobacterium bovis]|uniref:Medium-chain acyl-[acyl-carrier-protein] hydrolase n=1 Tax=Lachnobacterium bovis DSM 14045 TaxID=1122142 RepID=A0A1H3JC44_9FIRM|nr:thioesterase domain-containing protein [Lachnobacterium bovis]SDY37496.1 medium-chain acyl-[acyl-carrier-protein] hydrolase [Lachnobacterium bovis DSM 14045]
MEKIVNKWIAHESNIDKKINLFCFPHAGGCAANYAKFGKEIENMSIMPVQYPMREKRIREKMSKSIQELAQDFVNESIDIINEKEFCLLGHCSGSIVAYEVAKYMKKQYGIEPKVLFVSSCYAPKDYTVPKLSDLNDEELLKMIKETGFVSLELLENPIMFEYFKNIARADFLLQENYVCSNNFVLQTPIVAMYGLDDNNILNREYIDNWKKYTSSLFSTEVFEGNHFYLESKIKEVGVVIEKYLKMELENE